MSRSTAFRLVQFLLAAVIVWFAGRALVGYWHTYRAQGIAVRLAWRWVLASGAMFLLAYAILIQTWRAVLGAWGAAIAFGHAARIFAVSSLARYVPGKLWQIGAMGMMAQQRGVPPVAAAGAALLSTLVNIAAGILVVLVTGWSLVDRALYRGAASTALLVLLVAGTALALAPRLQVRIRAWAERVTKRRLLPGDLPARAVVYAVVGNLLAWLIYGVAFQLLTRGVLGRAPGGPLPYVAVYTLSYVFGYLVLFAPAGVGFRESAMILVAPAAGIADVGQAGVLAIASRLWLTVLEIAPGVLFLAFGARRRPTTSESTNANS